LSTKNWPDALDSAPSQQFTEGVREDGYVLSLVSDSGSQSTSVRFMAACSVLGIRKIFAGYDNPKGNAETERMIRTIKEDLVWPNDFGSPFELQSALDKWVNGYNTDFPHFSIGYKTPCGYEELCLSKIP
jgi:putative transposase